MPGSTRPVKRVGEWASASTGSEADRSRPTVASKGSADATAAATASGSAASVARDARVGTQAAFS